MGKETNGLDKKVVLIVEDDAFLAKAYEVRFKSEIIDVWMASDGNEAMAVLKKEPASVVLLDLMLPGPSGFEVLSAMKKSGTWKDVPVIILSNLGDDQDIERGKALGATGYLVKANVKMDEVVKKIKQYLT